MTPTPARYVRTLSYGLLRDYASHADRILRLAARAELARREALGRTAQVIRTGDETV